MKSTQQLFRKKKQPSLQPAIQKYEAIDSIVKAGAIVVDMDNCGAFILKELWDIYPPKKHVDVLSNILFYINFSKAAENKECDHRTLSFIVKDSNIGGTYNDEKKKIFFTEF